MRENQISYQDHDGALTIHQDTRVFLAALAGGGQLSHTLKPGRHAWLQVLRGAVAVNGQPLATSDGSAFSDLSQLSLRAAKPAEVMLFDLA